MAELRGLLGGRLRPVRWAGLSSRLAGRPQRDRAFLRSSVIIAASFWFLYAMLRGHEAPGRPQAGLHGADLVLTVGAVAGVGFFLYGLVMHRQAPAYRWIAFLAGAATGAGLDILAPERPGTALVFACVGFAAADSMLRSIPALAVGSVGILVSIIVHGGPVGELWTTVGMLGMFTGIRANRTREAAQVTERQNLVLAERSRIAREIHDILAHSLSAQLVHLEGARLLMVSGRMDEALDRVERARGLARSGLEETRRALATLRGDIPPMDVVLGELTEEHRLLADASCEVTVEGEPRDLSAKAGLAVIRTAQEALTNVRKHAPGAAVAVTLRYTDEWCELEVTDTGGEPGPLTASGGGYGLVGMRERAELIGGTLEAGPVGEGFRVLLRMPL